METIKNEVSKLLEVIFKNIQVNAQKNFYDEAIKEDKMRSKNTLKK
jgi:hypothetical protein